MKERYVNASEIGTYVFGAKSWQLSKIARRRKTNPNRERVPNGIRRTPSKSAAPNVRAGLQELSPLLFCCLSSRWHFDSSHRDRTTCTALRCSHSVDGCTSAVEAPQDCRLGLWFMTTPAANTSGGRLFHTVSGWGAARTT